MKNNKTGSRLPGFHEQRDLSTLVLQRLKPD